MLQFLSRRIGFILFVGVAIVFTMHLGMRLVRNSEVSAPSYDLVVHTRLAWRDTRSFLGSALEGDLGAVREDGETVPVTSILRASYVNSMGLLLAALIGAALVGLPLGALAALARHHRLTLPLLAVTVLGVSTPSFFAALLLRQGELLYVRTFGRPLVNVGGFGWDYQHMLLPALVLAARPLAYLTRASYLGLQRIMQEDFIRTAVSKGLTRRRTVNVHALRNIAVPILTALGVSLRFALGSLPVVEFFFFWPGLGLRMLEAIDQRQPLVVVTLAAALGLTFLSVNLLLEIVYRFVDPRLRET